MGSFFANLNKSKQKKTLDLSRGGRNALSVNALSPTYTPHRIVAQKLETSLGVSVVQEKSSFVHLSS